MPQISSTQWVIRANTMQAMIHAIATHASPQFAGAIDVLRHVVETESNQTESEKRELTNTAEHS